MFHSTEIAPDGTKWRESADKLQNENGKRQTFGFASKPGSVETLAAIKNPPVVFAKQANVTTGPQQINNGMAAPSRVRENEITPNKLLEANNGERMDTPTQGATGGTNPELEAVGATGPKTAAGKARVSRNPHKGAERLMLRELARILRGSDARLT